MSAHFAQTIAAVGTIGGGALAVGLPADVDSWSQVIEKFGVLAFVLICAVLGLSLLVPRALHYMSQYLERQDARQDRMLSDFLAALERRDVAQAEAARTLAESLDNLAARVDRKTQPSKR